MKETKISTRKYLNAFNIESNINGIEKFKQILENRTPFYDKKCNDIN